MFPVVEIGYVVGYMKMNSDRQDYQTRDLNATYV